MTRISEIPWAPWMAEGLRLWLMRGLEERLRAAGFSAIAGIDEVGRGALAGPVVAAAVVVEPGCVVAGVDDSKCLTAARRERVAERLRQVHPNHAIIALGPAEVDRLNILEATRLAMRRALAGLSPAPDVAVIDAVPLPGAPVPTLPLVRADLLSYAVACASILAKVARDRTMVALDRGVPVYGFARNKGYGSADHRRALDLHGPSRHHRLSFRLGGWRPVGRQRVVA